MFNEIKVTIHSHHEAPDWRASFFRCGADDAPWPFIFTILTSDSDFTQLEGYTLGGWQPDPHPTIERTGTYEIKLIEAEIQPKLNGPLEQAFLELKEHCKDPHTVAITKTFKQLGLSIRLEKLDYNYV